MNKYGLAWVIAICGMSFSTSVPAIDEPAVGSPIIMDVVIGPTKKECVGVAPMECLIVDGRYWYQPIEGFVHREGLECSVRIEQHTMSEAQVPADGSRFRYVLSKVLACEGAEGEDK